MKIFFALPLGLLFAGAVQARNIHRIHGLSCTDPQQTECKYFCPMTEMAMCTTVAGSCAAPQISYAEPSGSFPQAGNYLAIMIARPDMSCWLLR